MLMLVPGQLLLILSVIGLIYFLTLNILVLSLLAVCGKLIYDLWLRTGKWTNISQSDHNLRKKIAVAAVLAAIKIEDDTGQHNYPLPATALVSAWQAVMRSDILKRQRPFR
jgi:hypothetical protein